MVHVWWFSGLCSERVSFLLVALLTAYVKVKLGLQAIINTLLAIAT